MKMKEEEKENGREMERETIRKKEKETGEELSVCT